MENSKGPSNIRSMMYNGKNSLLPPKSPFPSISSSYAEYIPSSALGSKALPKSREANSHHRRTSSESFLIEEQPSWLDGLLDEPETPVRRGGHRRSSSDSFASIDPVGFRTMNYLAQDNKSLYNTTPLSSWGSQDFDINKVVRPSSFYASPNPYGKIKNKPCSSSVLPLQGLPSPRNTASVPSAGSVSTSPDSDRNPTSLAGKKDSVDSDPLDPKGFLEKKDLAQLKSLVSERDTKHAKQQFAQRSRVRKLQHIAALERNVQTLEAECFEVSAEFEFLNQKNIILSMENKALKHRLESLSQEQLLKYLEHEVLEREVRRLRSLYHQRSKSRDLDQQFAGLSLKQKEASPDWDSVTGHLQI